MAFRNQHPKTESGSVFEKSLFIYVEDPGAANFVAEFPSWLSGTGWRAHLYASGKAKSYLAARRTETLSPPDFGRDATSEFLRSKQAAAILVGTSENTHTAAFDWIEAARTLKIPSIGAVDASMNASSRFRGTTDRPLAHAPEYLLVPDQNTANEFESLGFDLKRILVFGHPHYGYVVRESDRLEAASKDRTASDSRKHVLFIAEQIGGLNPGQFMRSHDYTLLGRGRAMDRSEIVLEETLDALKPYRDQVHFKVRRHPQSAPTELANYSSEVDEFSKEPRSLDDIMKADLVVGMTSMALVEACLSGRATLSIVPRFAERDWLPTTALGLTRVATTRDEIREAFSGWLAGTLRPDKLRARQLLPFGDSKKLVEFLREITHS